MSRSDEDKLLVLLGAVALKAPTKKQLLDFIEERALIRLDSHSHEILETRKEPRWRNRLAFERQHLVESGALTKRSDGVWEATEVARQQLRELVRLAQRTSPDEWSHLTQAAVEEANSLLGTNSDDLDAGYVDLDDVGDDDPEERQQSARRVRQGQPKLRRRLLDLYEARCVVSKHGPENVLEAAHIRPHAGSGVNHASNALLLRADIHALFDDGLIRIRPESLRVWVAPSLLSGPYGEFHNQTILARADGKRPSQDALEARWQAAEPPVHTPG